jgi:hypothetical protein
MADQLYAGISDKPRVMTEYEEECVRQTLIEFQELATYRLSFAAQWEEIASLILPAYRNTFQYGSWNWPGQKKTEMQIDATGMLANERFSAICDSLLTPRNMTWHGLAPVDPNLKKIRRVRLWFEQVNRILFQFRYQPEANFAGQNNANYRQLGAFGTHGMFVDGYDAPEGYRRGIRYRSLPLGELYLKENHQGRVDGFIRHFRLNARQVLKMFGPAAFPASLKPALDKNSEMPFNILHRVCNRLDYDPEAIFTYQGQPWASYYVCMESKSLLAEGGYRSFPIACGRYVQIPGEVYGRSPAMMVLPALKTLNAEKSVFLRAGHRQADPVLLTADDGLVSGLENVPGKINPGGVNQDGKLLVQALPTGNISIPKEMMAEERSLINDAFLVTLFQILTESPQMTATEVIERTNEKGILLAPTVGRQQSEYIGDLVPRELDVLDSQGLLPPMPPELREAGGEYEVVHTSPLSRAMRAQEAAGFQRTVENVRELVAITQDQSLLDPFAFDVAVPEMADIQAVPESWMASPQQIAQKRKARAASMQQQQATLALPNQAAMLSAKAKMVQATGKGQPQGGMTGGGALSPASQGTPSFQGAG